MEFDPEKFAAKMAAEVKQEQRHDDGCIHGMHTPTPDESEGGECFAAAGGLGKDCPVARRRARIWTLLMLLQPAWFISGLWSEVPGGFYDSRAKRIFSFDECESRIEDRISELGLDADRVHSFPASVWDSLEAERAFYRLPFASQMERFRK